jgi:ABC-type multidrug transport system ATPase subunit
MNGSGLTVDHLTKRYGKKTALEDVSFAVGRGEIVGLIGPNGAGKSTTFGILAGLLRPDAGTLTFEGAALGPDRGKIVSLIPETPDVYPLLTVWEHLVFVARLCKLAEGWVERGEALLGRFGMLPERDTVGSALSKGMRQKTLVAATVLAGAPVLLLDEPMIGLDPAGQRELREILRDLRANGTAIVLSTHQLEAAQALCDRVVILKNGRTLASGSIDEIQALGTGTLEDVFLEITSGV